MVLNTKALLGVPVVTRSGQTVGKVVSFDLDAATGRMQAMHVHAKGIMAVVMDGDSIVPWDAIIEMSLDQVVIADGTVKAHATVARAKSAIANPSLMPEG